MLKSVKTLLKGWDKSKKHILVNAANGRDNTTGHYVRVLMIKDYPPLIIAGYLDQLDEIVDKEGATLRKTIRYVPSKVQFNRSMKYKLTRLSKSIEEQSETDPARNAEVAAKDTILMLRDSAMSQNRKLVDVTTFLTISAPKLHQIESAEANLKDWFDNMSASLDNLKREQLEGMRQTSVGFDRNEKSSIFFDKNHYGRVTSDERAARTYPMTRGTFSEGRGAYFGRRTEDGGFTFLNLCDPKDPRAQNITVLGKTGQGKSFLMKALVVSLIDENIHVFVFDLDGEWRDLCEEVGGVYIDHTTDEGRYFEPLIIMPSIPEIDRECVLYNRLRYKKAIKNGVRTLSLLAEGLTSQEKFEAGESIKRVFKAAHIDRKDQNTWNEPYNGPRPTIHLVFKDIERQAENNMNAMSLYDKIKIYFIGIENDMFSVEEPLVFQKAPLVVYKVGSGETEGNEQDENAKQAQIKMSMAFDIVNANIQKLKFEGEYFSAVLVDEGQRQTTNPEMRRAIFDWYTSIRKWNGLMILGSNTPAIMLENAQGVGMWENTNVKVYFYMELSAIRLLDQHSDVPIEIQTRISENEDTNRYILEYHKKYDELFMEVPPEEAALYKTRGLKNVG